jgi:hypothetical protein
LSAARIRSEIGRHRGPLMTDGYFRCRPRSRKEAARRIRSDASCSVPGAMAIGAAALMGDFANVADQRRVRIEGER